MFDENTNSVKEKFRSLIFYFSKDLTSAWAFGIPLFACQNLSSFGSQKSTLSLASYLSNNFGNILLIMVSSILEGDNYPGKVNQFESL